MSVTAKAYIEKHSTINRFRQILLSEDTPFDISKIYELTNNLNNVDDILYIIKNFDVSALFSSPSMDTIFPCYFNKGDMAWFSEKDGHVRYFTRQFNGTCSSYDAIDFLSIYYETENLSSIAKRLGDKVGVVFLDGFWKKGQEKKYRNNMEVLGDMENFKKSWPISGRFIDNNVDILILLNEIAASNLQNLNFSYHKEAMFFSSVRFLQERTGIDKGHISRLLSFMALLGMIEKIPEEYIPPTYLKKSKDIARDNGWQRSIGYYSVKDWGKNMANIEKMAEKALKLKVNPSNISAVHVIYLFGIELGLNIYPNYIEQNSKA